MTAPDDVRIERARADAAEARALTALARASKSHWGYAEEDLERWRAELTFTVELLRDPASEIWVARVDDAPRGVAALQSDATDPARVSLEHFWIDPAAMGRGVGRALFDRVARRAAELGGAVLEIESDPQAEGFYRRMGARRVGERPAPAAGQPDRVLPVLERKLRPA